jgi:hypothetical protein
MNKKTEVLYESWCTTPGLMKRMGYTTHCLKRSGKAMTSRERILTAIKGGEVDYVPMMFMWNTNQKLHEKLNWRNERERLQVAAEMGWDTWLTVPPIVSLGDGVSVNKTIKEDKGAKILRQEWITPSATLTEEIKLTDDWDVSELHGDYLGLMSDFRTPRYIEFPFKSKKDLPALYYIFPADISKDEKSIISYYQTQRKLADEFNYPLFVYLDSGMDWLMWLFPPDEQVYRAADEAGFIKHILDRINEAKYKRLELLLDLGVDGVIRRGWYESTDIWNPSLLRKFAYPALQKEIDAVHGAGKIFIYTLDTGAKAIAADINKLGIDCINGLDPVQGDMSVREIKEAFPNTTLWGGLSGPGDFGAASPDKAAEAVREVVSVYGRKRLILGMACSYRYYYPWENYLAAEKVWKQVRVLEASI